MLKSIITWKILRFLSIGFQPKVIAIKKSKNVYKNKNLMNWLETCRLNYEANYHKKNKLRVLFWILNLRVLIFTGSEVDYEAVANFVEHQKKYFLNKNFPNNVTLSN